MSPSPHPSPNYRSSDGPAVLLDRAETCNVKCMNRQATSNVCVALLQRRKISSDVTFGLLFCSSSSSDKPVSIYMNIQRSMLTSLVGNNRRIIVINQANYSLGLDAKIERSRGRCQYYSNSTATHQILLNAGDISS